jgi:hypothetical protein
MAQIAALRAPVEKMTLQFQSRGGRQIGGCYDDALVPAEFFRDDLADFLVRENFAGTLNSASDKDRAKIKMFEKYFGCSMPYDGIGEFLQSHHMAKHVGALSKQNFDQLKAYTDAVVEKLSSKNAHTLITTAATTTRATKALKICTLRCTFLTTSCKGSARLGRGQARR